MSKLLPPNQTALEARLSAVLSQIFDIETPITALWHTRYCPVELLGWLAWSMSVDEWDDNWSEEQKRNTILEAAKLHKQKGTIASIRRVLQSAGYGDATILENLDLQRYDGTAKYDGTYFYGDEAIHWAMYRIYLKRPVSIAQAEQVKRLLNNTAPARCHLAGLHFEQAQYLYNNVIRYDGTYTYGVA
ncbi:phage tail protein, P2 protein I family [Pasteurella testudinis DSM 23072]|uniref:Phage tail protein, P2 protein I family n=1 Tax=Pasteurella testudinis DSM 23072 TaxID=1122938 RepID=A0A1W1UNV3_9PAST|nr:phage tail protein I [Pasteurella testudinis]SMB82394.1 phage tail protein, P2 protein I family [Pasteurella testudinis DSM 23072]SUB52220.1 Bacteriophage P2-related tail formation protein [Pasteurella testudinis]